MKKLILAIFMVMMLTVSSAFAKKDMILVNKASANYAYALDFEISTLVESSIFNVMALKQRYPDYDYKVIVAKLSRLSTDSDMPAVRYKAFLAVNFFKNMEWFGTYDFKNGNSERVFKDISKKISQLNKIKYINGI